jgi:hypothetical protein
MRQNFDGLRSLALKEKSDLSSTIIFLNRKSTMFKILQDNKYLTYYRSEHGKIPLEAIQHLPASFGGSEAEMTNAIKKVLMEKIMRRGKK